MRGGERGREKRERRERGGGVLTLSVTGRTRVGTSGLWSHHKHPRPGRGKTQERRAFPGLLIPTASWDSPPGLSPPTRALSIMFASTTNWLQNFRTKTKNTEGTRQVSSPAKRADNGRTLGGRVCLRDRTGPVLYWVKVAQAKVQCLCCSGS